jgi:hypothetical protein
MNYLALKNKQKKIVAACQLGLTGGAQPFFPKSSKNKYTTTFGSPTAQEICLNWSKWSFLEHVNLKWCPN